MSSSSPFILSVVGDKVSRCILQNLFFQKMGYQKTEIWENSINFPEKINSLKEIPHLVLLDTNVIPLDGYEMLKLLRLNTAFQNTMIAACTASVMPEQVSQLKEAGFDARWETGYYNTAQASVIIAHKALTRS